MKKSGFLFAVVFLLIGSFGLVGSENFSMEDPLYFDNVSIMGPDVGTCQPSYCDSLNLESKEGPGGKYCCTGTNYKGFEECTDFTTKSTAIVNPFWPGQSAKEKTDYCEDGNILYEAYIDCEFGGQDDVNYYVKDCRDFSYCISWEYFCETGKVRRKRQCVDRGCSDGACVTTGLRWEYQLVSQNGDENYCSKRKEGVDNGWGGCSLCGRGNYDCDSDSECSGTLDCLGPVGGALDGCCYPGERWDTIKMECCECSSGACCDGCHYKSNSYVCDSHYIDYIYYCYGGECLGDDVYKRDERRYCSGSSSSCNGNIEWNDIIVHDSCGSNEFCDADKRVDENTPFSCSTAQCTEGSCCDSSCGNYKFRSTSYVCIDDLPWYGCPWGTNLGNDVGKKIGDRYCNGYSDACNGQFVWQAWTVYSDCNNKQYCFGGEPSPELKTCKNIECSSDSDCTGEYWIRTGCENNDVWGDFWDGHCENPGTKESDCVYEEKHLKKSECGTSGYEGERYCWNYNLQPSVYQRYVARWCESSSCKSSTEERRLEICEAGCTNGVCDEDTCTDDCSSGQTRCNGNIKQTCGNYDADVCLEWPSSISGSGNENCGKTKYCSANSCVSCLAGFGNCNENPLDSCEINLLIDDNNCGSCGNVCGAGKRCQNGICAIALQGDTNGDCKVDIFDLAKVGLCYGGVAEGSCLAADLNSDGKVDIFDLASVGLNYGKIC